MIKRYCFLFQSVSMAERLKNVLLKVKISWFAIVAFQISIEPVHFYSNIYRILYSWAWNYTTYFAIIRVRHLISLFCALKTTRKVEFHIVWKENRYHLKSVLAYQLPHFDSRHMMGEWKSTTNGGHERNIRHSGLKSFLKEHS